MRNLRMIAERQTRRTWRGWHLPSTRALRPLCHLVGCKFVRPFSYHLSRPLVGAYSAAPRLQHQTAMRRQSPKRVQCLPLSTSPTPSLDRRPHRPARLTHRGCFHCFRLGRCQPQMSRLTLSRVQDSNHGVHLDMIHPSRVSLSSCQRSHQGTIPSPARLSPMTHQTAVIVCLGRPTIQHRVCICSSFEQYPGPGAAPESRTIRLR